MEENKNSNFDFVVSDESVNKYGYKVLTEGIDLTEFNSNPVMFFNHHRSDDWTNDKERLPVGRWENLRIDEDNRLVATAVIDADDELGKKMISKIEKGMLRAASIGIQVVELSEDKELISAGQTRPTIKKSILQEISIVDIPANSNAMKLNFAGTVLNLSFDQDIEKLNKELPTMEKLGANLSELLTSAINEYAEANEMTLEEVREAAGAEAGISGDTVANIEDGEINCPPLERLEAFASFFGVSMQSLLDLATSDGCEYEAEETEEEETEEVAEDLRSTLSDALSAFVDGLKEKFKVVKKEGVESGALSELIKELRSNLSSFNSEKDNIHSEELEEVSSTVELLKAEIDLLKEKVSGSESTIEELKKQNKSFISKATKKEAVKEEAPISEDKQELKEKTKLEKQFEAFNTLGNKHLKKKKN